MGLEGSTWTIDLEANPWKLDLDEGDDFTLTVNSASISSNSLHIALKCEEDLFIFNGSTGEYVGDEYEVLGTDNFRLSPDGCDIWFVYGNDGAAVWRVGSGQKVLEDLELTVDIEDPPEGYPWGSSRGYRVTDDWWILGPDGKRFLMLPPPWRYYAVRRIWKGRLLALLHGGLSEPVILELEE